MLGVFKNLLWEGGSDDCEELCLIGGDHHELVLLGEEHGQGGVWEGCNEEYVVGQFCKDRGCDELGTVGVHHHVRGLQGEGGGAVSDHGGMGAVVVMRGLFEKLGYFRFFVM